MWRSLGDVRSLVSVLGNIVSDVLTAVVAALAVNGALAVSVYWCGVHGKQKGWSVDGSAKN